MKVNMKKIVFSNFPLGKRILILGLVLVFMIQLVNAADVCVVVDYNGYGPDETDSKCIEIDEGMNGYELLNEMGWSTEWQDSTNICKINDVGNDPSNCFGGPGGSGWMYNLVMGTKWVPPMVTLGGEGDCWNRNKNSGAGHYCTKDGDVMGLAYGGWGAQPDMFKINISKIYVDGDKQRESKTRRGKIVDVFPESVVEFKIELENLYHHSTDIEITDISIEGTIEDIDDGDDIDEELSEFDLAADKRKTEELKFIIPLEVEAKDRLVRIEVRAEDDAGIKYEKEFTFDLEVEKEKHDLRILKAELNKDSYGCGENALLELLVLNVGDGKEDVELSIVNEELEIDINEKFELSDDVFETSSRYEKRYNIWLSDNASKGTYAVIITATYGGEKETMNLDLSISDCEGGKVKASERVIDVQTGDIAEGFDEGAEISDGEDGATAMKEVVTGNLPLVLSIVFGVLFVIIVALGIGFWIVKR